MPGWITVVEEGRRQERVAQALIARGKQLFEAPPTVVEFTRHEAADRLLSDLSGCPHAFVLACVMDRQIKAEKAWMVPYELSLRLGGFSFALLMSVSADRLGKHFTQPYPLHRFPDKMSRYALAAIRRIGDVYDGNAARIWSDKPSSARVVSRFLAFDGVGPKIATMAANILARELKIPFSDYYSIDISGDVHVRRVFTRLGLIPKTATVEEIVYQARALQPRFPGLLDFPAFQIGREWCRPTNPECGKRYMRALCPAGADGQIAGSHLDSTRAAVS
jgi:endonuclease-3